MDELDERELLRLLRGELPAADAARVAARLEADPELRRTQERLRAVWGDLEAPPAAPAGLRDRVMSAVRTRAAAPGVWSGAPGWAPVLAVAGLVAGVAIGAGLSAWARGPAAEELPAVAGESFAETYAAALAEEMP